MTPTLQKKICMLGGFSVGKTSLVKRFVESVFSETYLTTVGVKIDKKTVDLSDRIVNLILWDLAGEDDISSLRMSYLRGSAGYVLVADGTRPSTLEVALSLRRRVEADLRSPAIRPAAEQERSSGGVGDRRGGSRRSPGDRLVGAVDERANRRRCRGCFHGARRARRALGHGRSTRDRRRAAASVDL